MNLHCLWVVSSQIRFGHSGSGVHRGNVAVSLLRSTGCLFCHAGASEGIKLFKIPCICADMQEGQGYTGGPSLGGLLVVIFPIAANVSLFAEPVGVLSQWL